MKQTLISFLNLTILLYLLNSCEYKTDEVYMRKVNNNVSPPGIQTIELNLNEDGVYLYSGMNVRFSFSSNKQNIVAVGAYLDDQQISISKSGYGSFTFDYQGLSEGKHKLEFKIFTKSGTGSIADHIGAEGYTFTKKWDVFVIKSFIHKISTEPDNGYLKLNWNLYKGSDFSAYILYKKINSWDGNKEYKRISNNYFVDSLYCGEYRYFEVKVLTVDGKIIDWANALLLKNIPKVSTNYIDNDWILTWNKSPYYKAISSISISINESNDFIEVKKSTDPNDTTVILRNLYFGQLIEIEVFVKPKYNLSNNTEIYTDDTYNTVGYRFEISNEFVMPINEDEFLYGNIAFFCKYSVSQKKDIERIAIPYGQFLNPYTFMISPRGKFFSSSIMDSPNTFYVNTSNLMDYKAINLYNSVSDYRNTPVSDVDIVVMEDNTAFKVYDINSSSILFKNDGHCKAISSNGEFLLIEKNDSLRLNQYSNSVFRTIGALSKREVKFFKFSSINDDQIILWDGQNLIVKRCSNFETIRNIAMTDPFLFNIDFYKNEFLTANDNKLYVRSFENGNILDTVPISHETYSNMNNELFKLINHSIVNKLGVMCFLNSNK